MIPHMNGLLVFIEMKQKNFFFWKQKFKMADSKKNSFSSSANSRYFFMKISWIGPWNSRIDWCHGHWCGSTYRRLSNISKFQGRRKVWKSEGARRTVVGIICSQGWDRVNCLENWGEAKAHPQPPARDGPVRSYKFRSCLLLSEGCFLISLI